MARFLVLWRTNPVAPWPTDPVEYSKFMQKVYAGIDDLIKKGIVKEMGDFLDGTSGYAMLKEKPQISSETQACSCPTSKTRYTR